MEYCLKDEGPVQGWGVYEISSGDPYIAHMGLSEEEARHYWKEANAPVDVNYLFTCTGKWGCPCPTCRVGM